jgi:hypothetical protein
MKTVSLSAHLVGIGFQSQRQVTPLDQFIQAVTNYSLARVEGNAPHVTKGMGKEFPICPHYCKIQLTSPSNHRTASY